MSVRVTSPGAVVVMGVSGSGKTTVGRLLAERLSCSFVDGDDLHPEANVSKMAAGVPLDDRDRAPWLKRVHAVIEKKVADSECVVVACSALRRSYRETIAGRRRDVRFVYLRGNADLIQYRMSERQGHFMPPELLASQFETLEEPDDALTVDIRGTPTEIVDRIVDAMSRNLSS